MIDSVQKLKNNREHIVYPVIADLPFAAQEAINVLRGNIQLSGNGIRVVAITSSRKEEGKSSVAVQLAKSFSALEKRIIYVDCDIRKSKTLRRYHIEGQTVGLSEYLCGNCRLEDIIYQTDNPYMDMVFTGVVAPNPSELLTGSLFEEFLQTLKDEYDYVIVDTPPINAVIDGAIVCKQCDGTVLVVEQAVTERSEAVRMKKQLDYAGVKIIGAVLNKVGADPNGYGYYGYGYYGYGYGYGQEPEGKGKRKKKKKK